MAMYIQQVDLAGYPSGNLKVEMEIGFSMISHPFLGFLGNPIYFEPSQIE